VKSAAGGGIFNYGGAGAEGAPARIINNQVTGTLADGIHNTHGAHHILVEGNTNHHTGDALIAVVSYDNNPEPCHDIAITHNTVSETPWARGITVVGGKDVQIIDNTIPATRAAGIYICAEESYHTYGVENGLVRGNRISKCPANLPAHSGIFISGCDAYPVAGVKLESNTIEDSPTAGIKVLKNVKGTEITGNQIKSSAKEGIFLLAPADTVISNNHISETGVSGIRAAKSATGFCRITDNDLKDIDTTQQPHLAAIFIEDGAIFSQLEITGNKYHAGRFHVEKVVECKIQQATVRNNN
jgi:parallel beta-helix repeat protein